jgi:hypothetical protein
MEPIRLQKSADFFYLPVGLNKLLYVSKKPRLENQRVDGLQAFLYAESKLRALWKESLRAVEEKQSVLEARQAVQRFCLHQQMLKKKYTFMSNIIGFFADTFVQKRSALAN